MPWASRRCDASPRYALEALDADLLSKGTRAVARDPRGGGGAHGRRPWQPEERTHLAEDVTAPDLGERGLGAVRVLTHDHESAVLDDVHPIAGVALTEHGFARLELAFGRRVVGGLEDRHHLDHFVGQRDHPTVVGRHHHHPIAHRQAPDEAEQLLDLDEVEVRGGFVGQDQRRVECQGARHRDPLLLAA